ncbi:26S proteasome complex subunit sem-1 [Endocarpon pusillum Z07020]|nr:26S proteasome complex subunit sem-1 [Endocarpon pusillum Z07020]ERF75613.1 26S proteasome complex subunit sem-1 [Endocarpon pusillum Z07020]
MSGAAQGSSTTAKLGEDEKAGREPQKEQQTQQPALLEEDDEFEDFPVEDWTEEESKVPGGNAHLWEESWDDDDQNEDFSKQLREELKKVEAAKSS